MYIYISDNIEGVKPGATVNRSPRLTFRDSKINLLLPG